MGLALQILQGTRPPAPTYRRANSQVYRAFTKVAKGTQADLRRISERLAKGAIDLDRWADLAYAALLDGHVGAAALGRELSGGIDDSRDFDRGLAVADSERQHLFGFRDTLAEAETLDADAIAARLDNYLPRLRGTANSSWLEEGDRAILYKWELGGLLDHCEDCVYFNSVEPMPADEWPTKPGENATPCMYNCGCDLVAEDGVRGFGPLELD